VDSKTIDCFLTSLYPPYVGQSIEEVATAMGLDGPTVAQTVAEFNAAIVPGGHFDLAALDDCRTNGLELPKSHWALPIDSPPFYGYPLRTGVTFTFLGLAVDRTARVQLESGATLENLFAAGEIMSGNILRSGYLGGFGLTIGTVFGRIAGKGAAGVARD
jgi:tricarballylate dehydrogenase